MDVDYDLVISFGHDVSALDCDSVATEFQRAHLRVATERRDPDVYAALQYIIPTALVVYVIKPYTAKFMEKLAEDNYNCLKDALNILWGKCFGSNRTIRCITIGTGKYKVHETLLASELSFIARTEDGQAFRLLFPKSITLEDFRESLETFYSLLVEHERNPTVSLLRRYSRDKSWRGKNRVLTIAQAPLRLVEVDLSASTHDGQTIIIELQY